MERLALPSAMLSRSIMLPGTRPESGHANVTHASQTGKVSDAGAAMFRATTHTDRKQGPWVERTTQCPPVSGSGSHANNLLGFWDRSPLKHRRLPPRWEWDRMMTEEVGPKWHLLAQ